MGTHQPIRKTVTPEIPDKLYFRIGDVARLCEVPAYVLRFWETEFPQLRPNKGGTGQRLYRKRDVEIALRIKSLLYDQGFTIPGARQVFKSETKVKEAVAVAAAEPVPAAEAVPTKTAAFAAQPQSEVDSGALLRQQARIRDLRDEMLSLLTMLNGPASSTKAAAEPKLQAMRPRLVLEPRPLRPEPSRLQLAQRDLFTTDAAE